MNCWIKSGQGLISQADAARIIGKTRARISQLIKKGDLEAYTFKDEAPYLSLTEVTNYEEKKKNKKK